MNEFLQEGRDATQGKQLSRRGVVAAMAVVSAGTVRTAYAQPAIRTIDFNPAVAFVSSGVVGGIDVPPIHNGPDGSRPPIVDGPKDILPSFVSSSSSNVVIVGGEIVTTLPNTGSGSAS